jgi:peptidoglycan hydrolase CwlO-like protein
MLPKKNIILVAAFFVPVLCCLIGVGAFVLVVTPQAEPGPPELGPNDVEALQQKVNELRTELESINKLLAKLELARKIDTLESSVANLLGEVSGLGEKLAIIETVIQDLNSSDDERQKRRDIQQAKHRLQACVPQFCLNQLAHAKAHPPHWNERG